MENHRVLWDTYYEDYNNRNERKNAWESIVRKYVPDFDTKSSSEKEALCFALQKKWKNIRTCYVREVKARKDESKGLKKKKTTYIYFELLRFLDPITKSRDQSVSQGDEERWMELEDFKFDPLTSESTSPVPPEFVSTSIVSDYQNRVKQEASVEMLTSAPSSANLFVDKEPDVETAQYCTLKRKRKEKEAEEDELLQLLKKKVMNHESRVEAENTDEDRMFLLSLVSELRKVPSDIKLRVKSDIIMAIVNGQNYARYGLANHSLVKEPQNNLFSKSHDSPLNVSITEDGPFHRIATGKATRKVNQKASTSRQEEYLVRSDCGHTADEYVETID